MEVLKFKGEKEYKEWLSWQSGAVKDKAKKFESKYPGVLPIVLVIDVDECGYCGGGEASHLFIPPSLESIINQIVGDP